MLLYRSVPANWQMPCFNPGITYTTYTLSGLLLHSVPVAATAAAAVYKGSGAATCRE